MSQRPKKDPPDSSGRVAFDNRGNATWEWRVDADTFSSEVDTVRVKALQEAAQGQLGNVTPPAQGIDPYRTANSPRNPEKKPRRTLDDMRKLSEAIKRARADQKPVK